MDIEIQSGAKKTVPVNVLAAASLGKTSLFCYDLISKVKIESNTTLSKYHLK
jgi:hypothetical protein